MFLMGELYLNLLEEIKRALQFSDFFFKSQTVIFKNDKSKIKSSNFAEADKKRAMKRYFAAFNSFGVSNEEIIINRTDLLNFGTSCNVC